MSIKTATVERRRDDRDRAAREEERDHAARCTRRWPTRSTRRDADAAVRAVLLTGQPGIFTSGNDIEDFMQRPPSDERVAGRSRFMKALIGCDKPVVAAVTGAAIGIGTTMLLHCDFVYVSDEARLAMPFVSLGLVPEFASSLIVPQLIGNARAAEKLLLGDPFTGADAVECGIANAVLPASEVVKHARRVAERFNALPPGAVRETKRLMRRGRVGGVLETIGVEGDIFGAAPAEPGSEGSVQCLLREAQARLLAVLTAPAASPRRLRARARRAGGCSPGTQGRARAAARRAGARDAAPRAGAARGGRRARRRVGAAGAPTLRLLVAGDSSAAGVGVARQEQAVVGHLVRALHRACRAAHRMGAARPHRPDDARRPRPARSARRRSAPTSPSSSPASTTSSTR